MSGIQIYRWCLALVAGVALSCAAAAAPLPAATEKLLGQLGIAPELMSGLDKELDVPAAWVEGARKEQALRVSGSWTAAQFNELNAPFRERYPFVKLSYSVGAFNERVMRPLVAYKEGRFITDVMTSFGGGARLYQEAGALEDLRSLPGFRNPIDGTGDAVVPAHHSEALETALRAAGAQVEVLWLDDADHAWIGAPDAAAEAQAATYAYLRKQLLAQ